MRGPGSPDSGARVPYRLEPKALGHVAAPPSWVDWDPAAEKGHGTPMRHLYTHGLTSERAKQRIAGVLAGEIVHSDSERDKLWCPVPGSALSPLISASPS